MKVKTLNIQFRYLGGSNACLSVDSVSGKNAHNDIDNEEAIIIFNSLVGEKENCITVKTLQQENQQLKEQLQLYETYLNRFFKINNKSYDGKIVLEQLQQRDLVIKEAIKYMELISLDKTDKYIAIKDYEEYEILLDILNKYKKEDKESE